MTDIKIKDKKINWICLGDKCPKNCCGPYKSDKQKKSLWNVEENLIPLTPHDYKVITDHGFEKRLVKKNDGAWYIQSKKDGSCPFLIDNKCQIYNLCRGTSCKSYPFFFSKYNGLYADMSCPGWGQGWTDMKKVKSMVSELSKLYRYQIKKAKNNLTNSPQAY